MRRVALVLGLLSLVGCDKGGAPVVAAPSPAVVTNVVERVREVVVTNVVTVTATNVVVERREPERILSARKTAPYLLVAKSLDEAQLRRLASDSAARVVECGGGSVALVEAGDRAVGALRSVVTVLPLAAADKIAADAGECVRIVPLSSIDAEAVTRAVRELGGDVVQVVTEGRPAVRAKMSYLSIRKLAERGDVRRIERDNCK